MLFIREMKYLLLSYFMYMFYLSHLFLILCYVFDAWIPCWWWYFITSFKHWLLKNVLTMKIKSISFDSTGTLLKVSKSVGYHYVRVLDSFYPGILSDRDKDYLTKEFNSNFVSQYNSVQKTRPNFGYADEGCYSWWKDVVRGLYVAANLNIKCYEFSYVFDETYHQFRTSKCWETFPETRSVLQKLHDNGVKIFVTSDFDEGLENILIDHDLYDPQNKEKSLVEKVITSYKYGICKPELLDLVKREHKIQVHVGNSVKRDIVGARSAGITPVFINRSGDDVTVDHDVITVTKLDEILTQL